MKIKGAAMLARAREVTSRFGEERWSAFLVRFSEGHERFDDAFFLTSRIPIDSFLAFQEALIAEFYGGDGGQYFESGRAAARWAFTEGPYLRLFEDHGDIIALLESAPARMWANYFDFGSLAVRTSGDSIEVTIEGLPSRHPYFMLTLPGYLLGALEIFGGLEPSCEEVDGGDPGTARWIFRIAGWSEDRLRHG